MNEFINRNYEAFLFFKKTEIPVISAIRGVCLGSAFELALLSHFRFCGEDAVLGLPETTFNLLPGVGGISGMVELVDKAVAMELILSGITFPAEDALKLKLVDRIIPKREVVLHAFDFAKAVMNNYHKGKKDLLLQKLEQTILPS
jgi:enoyl-CoA hydratase